MTPYWKCQVAGWSTFGVTVVGIPTLYGGLSWPVLARGIVGVLLGVVLTHQLRRRIREGGWLHLPLQRIAPRVVGASLLVASLMMLGVLPFLLLIIPPPGRTGPLAAIFAGHIGVVAAWLTIISGTTTSAGQRLG